MNAYRHQLPFDKNKFFLTDGGLETTLIFDHHLDLPEFAAFTLLEKKEGYQLLKEYYLPYIGIAKQKKTGFILESATWRASKSWGNKLGKTSADLDLANRKAIAMLEELRFEFEAPQTPMVISGCIGPQGDGYTPSGALSVIDAKEYHSEQIYTFSRTNADMVSAYTMNYIEEAIGVALAAKTMGMPVVISFTTETDGKLPSGQMLKEAVEQVDMISGNYPVYYMINCAHPSHFLNVLNNDPCFERIRAVRANASKKSHAQLDTCDVLDSGDKIELGKLYKELKNRLPALQVLGGCCGTDHTHVQQIYKDVI